MTATGRWQVGLAVALVAVGVGVLAGNTAIFLSSLVGLMYAGYGHVTRPPAVDLSVERVLEPALPSPGDDVDVVVLVTNEGDEPLPDVRVADEPPAELAVVADEPRGAVSLGPGETASVAYTVRARRGEHAFGDVTVVARNVSGSETGRERFSVADEIEPAEGLEGVPLAGQTIQYSGRVESETGGEGVEFYSVRSYQPTDSKNRVDWNRLAKTGELTTVEFREERAATVVVVVDVRHVNAVVRDPAEADGVELSKHAGRRLVAALLRENNRVGVALYGRPGHYLLPRTGRDHAARADRLLEGEWCDSFVREGWLAAGDGHVGRFCRQLGDEKQLVVVSPLLDDEPVRSIRRFRAYGHEVTLLCPTVADADSPGSTVERIATERRLSTLRAAGVRVLEWAPDEPLQVAAERGSHGWSR
ncbi:DUF58 domain-containing protein [Natronobeatus ordinarius]|uniref:DUF58 domain-containing protein n=1 Tax=Natronobeatus ordinarius TaxID=2963433 RepID=UPI0020CC7626|nr:DUF58 domain-containing protein [Natronobeatus ordinarius]